MKTFDGDDSPTQYGVGKSKHNNVIGGLNTRCRQEWGKQDKTHTVTKRILHVV